ncbi:type III secretion chaperone protein SigE [Leclercia adecarboxylata]|nr:type III secretion chaperone protein SigE [Leclercia adecarboxylata]KMN66822.1 type III secretion chaperone protein SigE [Leclercia sp. LK8]
MYTLLSRLYEKLGLDYPEDDAMLVVDDDLHIYFNESSEGLEMSCPFLPLPQDTAILQRALQLSYSGPVIFGTDADNTTLIATIRLPAESMDDSLVAGMEQLIHSVSQFFSPVC